MRVLSPVALRAVDEPHSGSRTFPQRQGGTGALSRKSCFAGLGRPTAQLRFFFCPFRSLETATQGTIERLVGLPSLQILTDEIVDRQEGSAYVIQGQL